MGGDVQAGQSGAGDALPGGRLLAAVGDVTGALGREGLQRRRGRGFEEGMGTVLDDHAVVRPGDGGQPLAPVPVEHPAERIVHGRDRVERADGPGTAQPIEDVEVRTAGRGRDGHQVEAVCRGEELDAGTGDRVDGDDVTDA